MSNFNFEEWENKKVAMHCSTLKEAKNFCHIMDKAGKTWVNGDLYMLTNEWYANEEKTCYLFNEGKYASLGHAKKQGYIILEWSDYTNEPFTKSDLKNGDVAVCRNGAVYIICIDTGTCITPIEKYCLLSDIADDLTDFCTEQYDIIDIYRPENPSQCSFSEHLYKNGKHVFHRDEEPVEITLEEIAKLKGVSVDRIKIIK